MSRICSRAQCRFQQSAGGLRCREWRGKDWALRSGPRWGPEAAGARSIPSGSSAHDAVHANQLRDVHGTGGKREQQLSAISMAMLQLKPLKGRGSGGSKSSKTEPPEHASAGNRWFSDLSEGKVGALPNGRRRWVSRAHLVVEMGTGAWEECEGRIWRLAENLSRLGCGSETPRRLGNLTWVRVHNSKGTMPSMPSPHSPRSREARDIKHQGQARGLIEAPHGIDIASPSLNWTLLMSRCNRTPTPAQNRRRRHHPLTSQATSSTSAPRASSQTPPTPRLPTPHQCCHSLPPPAYQQDPAPWFPPTPPSRWSRTRA